MFSLRKQDRRRRQFKAALVAQGTTLTAWAAKHGVTHTHLNYVLRGVRHSPRLIAAVEAVIAAAARRAQS